MALLRVTSRLTTPVERRVLLELMLDGLIQVFGASRCSILLPDEQGSFRPVVWRNLDRDGAEPEVSRTIIRRALKERRTIFLLRTGAAEITALDSTCTHLGCRVSWDAESQELVCPCHGGRYDRTGKVTAGPPPAPLTAFQTQVTDGTVRVRV